MNPHILHISNAFAQSALYKQLVSHLDDLKVHQTVYSAVRTQKEADYDPPELSHLNIHIRYLLQSYDRLFFRNKIRKISKDIIHEINLSSVDLIHAHTLYSDGATALKIKKKTGIPYIVTVRSTDLIAFQKYRPDLRWRRDEIVREADKVIFISPVYKDKFLKLLRNTLKKATEKKNAIIPNGIDPLFLENSFDRHNYNSTRDSLKLLYVGTFIKRKNILSSIEATDVLSKHKDVVFTIVGGGEDNHTKIKGIIESDKYSFLRYLGKVKNRKELRKIYATHDIFIMPSSHETFGLVYIEALSQGLPIIHTRGEAVDGYFNTGNIVESVNDPHNIEEVANKVEALAGRLDKSLQKECIKEAKNFDWEKIAEKYKDIYNTILGNSIK